MTGNKILAFRASERHKFRADEHTAEEHTAERVTISVRHDFRAQRGGEHRGARHDFIVVILLSRFVRPFSSALNAQRGEAHREARRGAEA